MTVETSIGASVEALDTPFLLIDGARLRRNLRLMQEITHRGSIRYRPHVKTHKSPIIARMQVANGAAGVCCSKIGEAEVMVEAGIDDILVTSEIAGPGQIARLIALRRRAAVAIVVDHPDHVALLDAATQNAGCDLDVVVEVDVGQTRCGVGSPAGAVDLAQLIDTAPLLRFRGLQGYHGTIQMTHDCVGRAELVKEALDRLLACAEAVRAAGLAIDILTGGGTGSLATDIGLGGLNELQPGSYVFMDSAYTGIGWEGGGTAPFENALTVIATVVSRPAGDRAILDAGLKTMSMDHGPPLPLGHTDATFSFGGDEHGQLSFRGTCPLRIGDRVTLLPSHCDTTVNLHDEFVVAEDRLVTDIWPIAARGRIR